MSPSAFLAVAVQYRAAADDYRTAESFASAMRGRMEQVRPLVRPEMPTMVAFPEDVGLGLLLSGDLAVVSGCSTLVDAAGALAERHRGEIRADPVARELAPVQAMLRVLTRRKVEPAYRRVFAGLAREYGVYLCAGSAPMLLDGAGAPGNGSCFYGPDGALHSTQFKTHLIPIEGEEGVGLTPGTVDGLQTVDLPFARAGVAICWDAFHGDVLAALDDLGANVLIQPSFNPEPWTPEKAVDWKTGAWQAVQSNPRLRAALNPMMVGGFFDLQAEGRSSIVAPASRAGDGSGYAAMARTHDQDEIVAAVVDW